MSSETNEFWEHFNKHLQDIKIKLNDEFLKSLNKEYLMEIKLKANELQKYATDGARLLPLYDVKRTQEDMETCWKKIRKFELILNPRTKFKFSCRKKNLEKPKSSADQNHNEVTDIVNSHDNTADISKKNLDGSYLLHSKTNEVLLLSSTDLQRDVNSNKIQSHSVQLYINECEDCLISTQSPIGSVRIENTNNCTIVLGPCSTSNYFENCSGCTVFLICHQLRIHNCTNCQFHVLVNTHPIIEDCSQLKFYRNRCFYPNMSHDLELCGLTHASCWNNVIDFRSVV